LIGGLIFSAMHGNSVSIWAVVRQVGNISPLYRSLAAETDPEVFVAPFLVILQDMWNVVYWWLGRPTMSSSKAPIVRSGCANDVFEVMSTQNHRYMNSTMWMNFLWYFLNITHSREFLSNLNIIHKNCVHSKKITINNILYLVDSLIANPTTS